MSKCEVCSKLDADFLIKERIPPFRKLKICSICYYHQDNRIYKDWECASLKRKQTDLVADFGFPNVPKTLMIKGSAFQAHPVYPCSGCDQKGYCYKHSDYLNCDRYLQWRKERGFSSLTKVGK